MFVVEFVETHSDEWVLEEREVVEPDPAIGDLRLGDERAREEEHEGEDGGSYCIANGHVRYEGREEHGKGLRSKESNEQHQDVEEECACVSHKCHQPVAYDRE